MTDHTTQQFWDQYAKPGATHYNPETKDWYRAEGDNALAWATVEGGWVPAAYWNERKHLCVARPGTEWDGRGLPPVGTVCEVLWNESRMEYLRTKVFGVNEHGQPIHRFDEGPKKYEYQADVMVTSLGTIVFRPLKTPAQLAAEKREADQSEAFDKACEDIRDTIQALAGYIPVDSAARRVVKAMIEQGYRKAEKE